MEVRNNHIRKKENAIINTVSRGQQVPLSKFMTNKEIYQLNVTSHAIERYKQRFKKLYDIQIEQDIKSCLAYNANIVELGKFNRFMVYSKGYIFVLDKENIYTVYDYNGNDRNNTLDDTQEKMFKVQKKTRYMDELDKMLQLAGLRS